MLHPFEPPLFEGPVPKRRRTSGLRSAAREWPSAFDSRLAPAEAEDDSVLSDEAEVALALAGLANATPSFAPREPEEEPEQAAEGAQGAFQRRRKQQSADRALREPLGASYPGPSGAGDGILPPPGSRTNTFRRLPQPGLAAAKPEPIPGPREFQQPIGDAPARPAFKRCASHVYIARFIEYQTNKSRLQQAQQWQSNGFPGGHAHGLANQHLPEPEPAEQRLSGANGGFARQPPPPTLPEPAAALPLSQELPSVSGAHPFLGPHGFPGPGAGAGPGMQLPPAYAHLLAASQQQQQPGGFPFLPPGQQLGGGLAGPQQQQQQAALAQALAGASRFFAPYSMQLLNGGLAQHLAAMAGLPIPSGAPSPSLPLQLPVPKGHPEPGKLPNGSGLKQEELPKALAGLPPGALAGVDLERLRAMLPPGFFEQRNGNGLADPLAGLKAPGEQWGPSGLPTRM